MDSQSQSGRTEPARKTRVQLVAIVAVIAVAATVGIAFVIKPDSQDGTVTMAPGSVPALTGEDLRAAAAARTFFGHQSVGGNIIDGVAGIYRASGPPGLQIITSSEPVQNSEGYLAHAQIGANGDPVSKIRAFDAMIRGGIGEQVDVALMKFCYIDVVSGTDTAALLAEYERTLDSLERDYPDVTFLHATVPVTTEPSVKARLKAMLGRDDHLGPADNAAREQINSLLRQRYGASGRLVDIASIEATSAQGTISSGSSDGRPYLALQKDYAADSGHLNEAGAAAVAAGLVKVIATQSQTAAQ